jgi:hypothetical protein
MTFSSQMTNIDPEKFIAELNKLKMTPEERKLAAAEELAKQFGELLGSIIILLLIPTIIWSILTFIFAINIAWVKVFGAYFLFNLFKNIIVNSLKK